ncbi:MAG: pyridoxamine kinase [Sphaerochaetaceae bacterium]|nr:pyridoxamine kinase [Sphaerochaetaceae bacterium]
MFADCAAIHDLSCYAKSSLTVVSPILEAMGVEVCPIPTALLSTQTDGFKGYLFEDLTSQMHQVIDHWQRLGLAFDAVYSGFLGSVSQVALVESFISVQRNMGSPLVLIDPVLGDAGKTYGPMNTALIARMRSLVAHADVITPNTTEAALLLGHDWQAVEHASDVYGYARSLADLGPKRVVVTSVLLDSAPDKCSVAWYDRTSDDFGVFSHARIDASYPGAGDLFASLLCGLLLWGRPFPCAVEQAALWVSLAIARTSALGYPYRHGVCPSSLIPTIAQCRLEDEKFKCGS